jgi:hypothetical protein
MADLNVLKTQIISESVELNNLMKSLYKNYEGLYKESLLELSAARTAAGGSTAGLEEFYSLVQMVKSNRNIISTLMRGLKSIRPMDKFTFIEEDFVAPEKPKAKVKGSVVVPQMVDELKIPEEDDYNA